MSAGEHFPHTQISNAGPREGFPTTTIHLRCLSAELMQRTSRVQATTRLLNRQSRAAAASYPPIDSQSQWETGALRTGVLPRDLPPNVWPCIAMNETQPPAANRIARADGPSADDVVKS